MDTLSKEKIHEALNLLEDVAKDTAMELCDMITEKYPNLKEKLMEKVDHVQDSLSSVKDRVHESASHVKDFGGEKARKVVADVDENVHSHTWSYLSGIALSSLLLGYILGKKR